MSKNAAPTKATGGGGYTFADKVAAGFLAQMLRRKFPFEPDLGPISAMHFETRDVGNVLDDLLHARHPRRTTDQHDLVNV